MLDASAYPALGVVRSHLRQRQRMVAPTASMNPALVTAGPEFGLDLGRPISAVAEHIIAGVALVQQPIQRLAVVHGRIGQPAARRSRHDCSAASAPARYWRR